MFATIISILTRFPMLFVKGTAFTLWLSFLTVLFGTCLGAAICLARRSKFKPLAWITGAYVEIIRGTPILLQLYIFYFMLPQVTGLELSDTFSVTVALVLNSGAYVSELIRAGIQAVDKGQTEAARSLGLSPQQTMMRIVMPQAIKNILPALGNEFVMIIKESSLASTFFVGELMTTRNLVTGALNLTIEPLIIVGVIYFILTFSLTKLIGRFERNVSAGD